MIRKKALIYRYMGHLRLKNPGYRASGIFRQILTILLLWPFRIVFVGATNTTWIFQCISFSEYT